jgi:hypothetical protein
LPLRRQNGGGVGGQWSADHGVLSAMATMASDERGSQWRVRGYERGVRGYERGATGTLSLSL